MFVRIAIGLVVFAGSSFRALADDNDPVSYVDSPEAVRKATDEAAPELLHARDRAVEVLAKVGPKELLKVDGLQKLMKEHPEELGAPLGWSCAGERKLGDVVREFDYVCRYENAPLVWRFLAMRKGDRWSLVQALGNGEVDRLFRETPQDGSPKSKDYADLCDKIAAGLAHEDRDVIKTLKVNFVPKLGPKLDRLFQQTESGVKLLGGSVSCDRVEAKEVAGSLAQCSYIVQCGKQNGMYITIQLYHADKDWKVIGFSAHSLDTMKDDLLAGAGLEPAAAESTQTAARPKTSPTDDAKTR